MINNAATTTRKDTAPSGQCQDGQTTPTLEIMKNPFIPSNTLRNSLAALNHAVEVLGTQIAVTSEGSSYLVSASFKGKPILQHRLYCQIHREDPLQYEVKRDFIVDAGGYQIFGFQNGSKLDLAWLWKARPQASLRWWTETATLLPRLFIGGSLPSPAATMKIDVSDPQNPTATLDRWAQFSWMNGSSAKEIDHS
jgi:hypothetical protein